MANGTVRARKREQKKKQHRHRVKCGRTTIWKILNLEQFSSMRFCCSGSWYYHHCCCCCCFPLFFRVLCVHNEMANQFQRAAALCETGFSRITPKMGLCFSICVCMFEYMVGLISTNSKLCFPFTPATV